MQSRQAKTLVADTVSTEIFLVKNTDQVVVTITKGSTGPIYFTVDGSTPTVGGDNTIVVQSVGDHARVLQVPTQTSTNNQLEVKLISASTDGYSVEIF